MSKLKSNNLLINMVSLVIDFISNKIGKLNLKVSVVDNKDMVSKFDSDIFFKAGQLLMIFYILNIKNISRENIKYRKNKFYICMPISITNKNCIKKITSENIILHKIHKSTFNEEFLPAELGSINEKNLFEIENGFALTYKTLIDKKMNLISYLKEYDLNNNYFNLIKDISLLNPHDLSIQLKFIRLRFQKKLAKNDLVERLVCCRDNHDDFIEASKNVLDLLIKNATISLDKNGMELMWMGYIHERLEPIKYRNIYIALLFAYIGQITFRKYYLEAAKQSINPLLMDLNDSNGDYKNILGAEYYEVLKLLYLLNNFIEFRKLDKFIDEKKDLFDLITLGDKLKCNSETEILILEAIYNKSLDLLNVLILE